MSRHILDRSRPGDGSRTDQFARIERRSAPEGSHRAAVTLHRREQTRSQTRTAQFLRIARGQRA